MNRVMVDIETANSEPDSIILSIGFYNIDTNIGFALQPDVVEQERRGRSVGIETIKWWMTQGEDARRVFQQEGMKNSRVAEEIANELDIADQIWANGPDFDCVILANYMRMFVPEFRWPFWNHRCYRTFKNCFSDFIPAECKDMRGVAHDALDDAKYQGICLRHILDTLARKGVRVN